MLLKASCLLLVVICYLLSGIVPPSSAIVGGYPEEIEAAPWMVSITLQNVGLICGGVLVSPRLVLTAAYCVFNRRPTELSIRVGSKFADRDGYVYYPENIIIHNQFNATIKDYNLALLTLPVVLRESRDVYPVKIREATEYLPVGSQCIISGYGSTDAFNPQAFKGLKSAMVRVLDRENCAQRMYPWAVTPSMMCASGNGEDGCAGDGGGPLICAGKLTAIISWGKGCGRDEGIGVYADLTSSRRWMTDYGVP